MAGDRAHCPAMSPQKDGPVPPCLFGVPPTAPAACVSRQSLPKSCCSRTGWSLSPPSPQQLTVSPVPVGAFWAGGPRPAPLLVPCAPQHARGARSARSVPAGATPSRPRLPTQPVPPLRLNIDRCQPCGRAAVAPRGRAGEGGEPGTGHKGRVAGGPRALGSSRTHRAPTAARGRAVRAADGDTGPRGCWGVTRDCRGSAIRDAELGPVPGVLGKGWGGTAPPARGGPSPPGGTRGG